MKNRFTAAGRILLIVALLLTAFSGLPFGSAEAASYKIHHETLDGNDYYYVPSHQPTDYPTAQPTHFPRR